MSDARSTQITHFTILDETGPNDTLLFGCKPCGPDKKLTSHMLEAHMRSAHDASKFTVDAEQRQPARNQNRGRKTAASAGSR